MKASFMLVILILLFGCSKQETESINKIYSLGDFYYLNNPVSLNKKADWSVPDGVIKQNLCKETCCLKTDWCESYSEYFLEENIPTDKCEEYSNPLLRFK